ncbi:hypothetical protein HQ524_03540 [Candidatus Uhrbacteria bacterium]|nr:hypothetical protein [Candidatus Uhrbacteria bacterium]
MARQKYGMIAALMRICKIILLIANELRDTIRGSEEEYEMILGRPEHDEGLVQRIVSAWVDPKAYVVDRIPVTIMMGNKEMSLFTDVSLISFGRDDEDPRRVRMDDEWLVSLLQRLGLEVCGAREGAPLVIAHNQEPWDCAYNVPDWVKRVIVQDFNDQAWHVIQRDGNGLFYSETTRAVDHSGPAELGSYFLVRQKPDRRE